MNRYHFQGGAARLRFLGALPGGLALALVLVAGSASACPDQLPPGMQTSVIGQEVLVNGLKMAIRQVQGKDKVDDVLAATTLQWTAAGFIAKQTQMADWKVLTVVGRQCLVTLQLTERGGAFGYFARSVPDPAARARVAARALVPPHATVTSAVESNDDGRKSLVMSMSSNSSVEDLRVYFSKELMAAKWSTPRARAVTHHGNGASGMFISAQRQREQIDIVLWPKGKTQVVMTIAEAL